MQGFRRIAIHLALIALLLRGFLPAGWMPNIAHDGGTFLVACSMATGHQDDGKAPADDPHAHDACPFAAAASLAAPVDFIALPAPQLSRLFVQEIPPDRHGDQAGRHSPAAPRAPPLTA